MATIRIDLYGEELERYLEIKRDFEGVVTNLERRKSDPEFDRWLPGHQSVAPVINEVYLGTKCKCIKLEKC